jgi:hypothetical protein
MDNSVISIFTCCLVFLIIVYVIEYYFYDKAKAHIQEWAKENGFTIEKVEYRFIRPGPFFGVRTNGVFRLLLKDNQGHLEKCWLASGIGISAYIRPSKLTVIFDSEIQAQRKFIKTLNILYRVFIVLLLISLIACFLLVIKINFFL